MTRQHRARRRAAFVARHVRALEEIRALRAANRAVATPRGARYVIPGSDGTEYELWAVRDARLPDGRRYPHVVLRGVKTPNAFLIFDDRTGPPDPRGWVV